MNYLLVHINATKMHLDSPGTPAKYKHNETSREVSLFCYNRLCATKKK